MRVKPNTMKNILNNRLRRCHLMMSFLGLVAIVGLASVSLFTPSNVSAEVFEAEQGLSFTLNSSVAVSITGGTGSGSDGLTIDDLVPGNSKDSNIITVTASSNSASGYTLSSSVGSSTYASTELRRNGTETANKFASLTESKASLSAFDPGYWGYSYSTNGGTSWISGDIVSGTSAGYNGLPLYTTTTPIKLINSSSASSSSIQFKIGAKATSSQVSGAYTNIINFIGVGKVITTNYAITFSDPSGEASGMPSQQTGTTDSGAVQLPSTVPTRTNYIFKGWCTIDNTSDPTTCTGINAEIIQPGNFLPLNTSSASITKTLYAVWKDNSVPFQCDDQHPCMQDYTLAKCQSEATGAPVTLYDKRDGSDYTVRYVGNNCWMTQNLRITKSNGQPDWTISKEGSNFNNVDTWNIHAVDLAEATTKVITEPASRVANSADVAAALESGYTVTEEQIGVWYNACAASANNDNGCVTGSFAPAEGEVTGDICPYGWHVPNDSADNISGNISSLTEENFTPAYSGWYVKIPTFIRSASGVWVTPYAVFRYYSSMTVLNFTIGTQNPALNIRCIKSS